jgi:hypothetical protein
MTAVQDNVNGTPPPPPEPSPPSPGDGLRALKEEIKAKQRMVRRTQVQSTTQTLRTLHKGYYYAIAGVLAALLLFLAVRWFLAYQKSITLALADESTVSTAAPAPVVSEGMPNPLEPLPLSTGAVYVLGANVRTNDKGEAVGFTELPPLRSTSAMTQLLEGVDLCRAYISLGAVAEVVVTFEPTPGAYPLIDPSAEMCAAALTPATDPTLVPTPTDPIPSTVPAS